MEKECRKSSMGENLPKSLHISCFSVISPLVALISKKTCSRYYYTEP